MPAAEGVKLKSEETVEVPDTAEKVAPEGREEAAREMGSPSYSVAETTMVKVSPTVSETAVSAGERKRVGGESGAARRVVMDLTVDQSEPALTRA